ncbi:MAG: hypothetical protein WD295_03770, partial [Bacteroidota bacterium]
GRFNRWLCTGVNNGTSWKGGWTKDSEGPVDFACGVLLMIRRNVIDTVGMFDERFFMYFEDVEFSRRVLRHFSIAYTPRGAAFHGSGGGKGWKNYTEVYLYHHTRNRQWTFADDSRAYRMYVAGFTTLNAVAKSMVIIVAGMVRPRKAWSQLSALWRGIQDGMRGSPVPRRSAT